jgi:hypothetical protein
VKVQIYKKLGIPVPTRNESIPATARKWDPKVLLALTPFTVAPLIVYLVFWGACSFWGGSKAFIAVLEAKVLLHDFQAKIGVQDAALLLARCLQDSLPSRNATVEDFSACLTAIGVKEHVGG